jgi:hypothetical protein
MSPGGHKPFIAAWLFHSELMSTTVKLVIGDEPTGYVDRVLGNNTLI